MLPVYLLGIRFFFFFLRATYLFKEDLERRFE